MYGAMAYALSLSGGRFRSFVLTRTGCYISEKGKSIMSTGRSGGREEAADTLPNRRTTTNRVADRLDHRRNSWLAGTLVQGMVA